MHCDKKSGFISGIKNKKASKCTLGLNCFKQYGELYICWSGMVHDFSANIGDNRGFEPFDNELNIFNPINEFSSPENHTFDNKIKFSWLVGNKHFSIAFGLHVAVVLEICHLGPKGQFFMVTSKSFNHMS